MSPHASEVEGLVWELRRAFRDLAAAADRELASLGIHARDRAFLEFLARERKPVSLSAIADKYSVSRQHIHQTYNALSHPGWVEEAADPRDRRTVLVRLSRNGRAAWNKIREADDAFFEKLSGRLNSASVSAATSLLRELRQQLAKEAENA